MSNSKRNKIFQKFPVPHVPKPLIKPGCNLATLIIHINTNMVYRLFCIMDSQFKRYNFKTTQLFIKLSCQGVDRLTTESNLKIAFHMKILFLNWTILSKAYLKQTRRLHKIQPCLIFTALHCNSIVLTDAPYWMRSYGNSWIRVNDLKQTQIFC